MGLIAELQQRNAELERRVAHLELAFDGLRQLCNTLMDSKLKTAAELSLPHISAEKRKFGALRDGASVGG